MQWCVSLANRTGLTSLNLKDLKGGEAVLDAAWPSLTGLRQLNCQWVTPQVRQAMGTADE